MHLSSLAECQIDFNVIGFTFIDVSFQMSGRQIRAHLFIYCHFGYTYFGVSFASQLCQVVRTAIGMIDTSQFSPARLIWLSSERKNDGSPRNQRRIVIWPTTCRRSRKLTTARGPLAASCPPKGTRHKKLCHFSTVVIDFVDINFITACNG